MPRIDITSLDYQRQLLKETLPDLVEGVSFEFTSPVDLNYNCLAWALSYNNRYLDRGNGCFWAWPDCSPETAEGWACVCKHHQFELVPDGDIGFTPGIEKVVILRNDVGDLHAARQSRDGKWKSKLGWGPDIDHIDLRALERAYGKIVIVLQKPRPDWRVNNEAQA